MLCIQSVSTIGDNSNPPQLSAYNLNFMSIETIRNRKVLKPVSVLNLHPDHLYECCKERPTRDSLAILNDASSSSLSHYGETFAVPLNLSKSFDRALHKRFLSELSSFGFYPSPCVLIPRSLYHKSILTDAGSQCSTPKAINSGVPQSSLLFLTILLSIKRCTMDAYPDDSTLHYSTS